MLILCMFSFQTILQWESRSPLSFRLLEYTNYKPRKPDCSQFKHCSRFLNSHMSLTNKCTVMFLSDLAKADWISIPCDQQLLYSVVCYKNKHKYRYHKHESHNDNGSHFICSADHVVIQGTYHIFLWVNVMNSTKQTCKQFNSVPVNINRVNLLKQVLDAFSLESQFPPTSY